MHRKFDIENDGKNYLHEKELLILYWLLKKKHISTLWSSLFTPAVGSIVNPIDIADVATLEEKIATSNQQSIEKYHSKMQSPTVLSYLLEIGEMIDKKGYLLNCDAEYALVEGGFLTEQKDEKTVPIKLYTEVILKKKGQEDFIELINKLITKDHNGFWDKKDAQRFLEIYIQRNRSRFSEELEDIKKHKSLVSQDKQTQLAQLIFEHLNIRIAIKNTKILQKFLSEYIGLFVDDQLNGLSQRGLTGRFFSTSSLSAPFYTKMFGFRKQRDILTKYIQRKYNEYQRRDLEIEHPYVKPEYIGDDNDNTFKITPQNKAQKMLELFLFVHTMIALDFENYLEVENFSYGAGMFDLYDRGILFQVKFEPKTKEANTIVSPDNKIREIIFVKKKTEPKLTYSFYINGNVDAIKPLRSDSAKLRKLIAISESQDIEFDKDLLDYVNSNSNCALYEAGKYQLTKILERNGNYLRVCYGIRTKVISETEYRKKLNKKNRT